MAFEVFKKRVTIFTDQPRVSIKKDNNIALNEAAVKAWLDKATHAHLFFDREAQLIGIKPLEAGEADRDAYTLNKTSRGKAKFIFGAGFLRHCGVDAGQYRSFAPRFDSKERMIVIDLKNPLVSIRGGVRARSKLKKEEV